MFRRISTVCIVLSLILMAALAFAPARQCGFLNWDDHEYITRNPDIHSLSPRSCGRLFTTYYSATYVPLTMLSFAVEYALWGADPRGYHIINVILHVLNTLLVFCVVRRVSTSALVAWSAALLWAVHPLRVESVVWVTERKDVLYALFYLAAVLAYLRSLAGPHRARWLAATSVLFVLSALSKGMAMTLPGVLLLLDWYAGRPRTWKLLAEKLPVLIGAGFTALAAWYGQHAAGAIAHQYAPPVWQFPFVALHNVLFYIQRTAIPVGLSPLYPHGGRMPLLVLLFTLGSAALCAGLLWLLCRRGLLKPVELVFGLGWYLLTLLPVLQVVRAGMVSVADRFSYLPALGLTYILGLVIVRAAGRRCVLAAAICLTFAGGLSVLTWNYARLWRDPVQLWSHVLRVYPGFPNAHVLRGTAYAGTRAFRAALADLNTALSNALDKVPIYVLRGDALQALGRQREACDSYTAALRLEPATLRALIHRGAVWMTLNLYTNALADFDAAAQIAPYDAQLLTLRARAYYTLGAYDLALSNAAAALVRHPHLQELHALRADAFMAQRRFADAAAAYAQAPDYLTNTPDALFRYGDALGRLEHYDQAVNIMTAVLSHSPSNLLARHYRSIGQRVLGHYRAALADIELALRLAPENPDLYYDRGALYEALHDAQAAQADYARAIALAPRHFDALFCRGRLALAQANYTNAVTDLTTALSIITNYPEAFALSAAAYLALRNYRLACADNVSARHYGWRTNEMTTPLLETFPAFTSRFVAARNVQVYLPACYRENPTQRCAVLYMHDGQNLFDPATSFIGVDWGVHEALEKLVANRQARPAIIVAIWNTPQRRAEYLPAKLIARITNEAARARVAETYGPPLSDAYLRFIVRELKPFIDARYRTLPERDDTFIMGSSMGGLISLYAVCEYPEVFGGAGCLSTHWPAGDGMMIEYVRSALPAPGAHKLYFDHGTETLDATYEVFQCQVDAVMRAAGYTAGTNWITRRFPGAEHSERAWRERVHLPLAFLLHPCEAAP